VSDLAQSCGAWVIEDAAQALGATNRGQSVGTLGDLGFYSLAAGKGLTLYEGGVLVARDAALRQALRETSAQIAPYRVLWEMRRLAQLVGYAALYRPETLRLAYGIPLRRALKRGELIKAVGDDFSSAIPLHRAGAIRRAVGANAALRLPAFLEVLSAQAISRKKQLETISGVTVIGDSDASRGSWPFLMVLMATERARDAALARLWTAGLGVSRLFIHALPDYPYLAKRLGSADVTNARDFAARMLTISNSPWLRDRDFAMILSTLADVSSAVSQQR